MKPKHILLDMDGVIADFFTEALARCNAFKGRNPMTAEEYRQDPAFDMAGKFEMTDTEFWKAIDCDDFWLKLKPMPHAEDLIHYITTLRIPFYIASSPSMSPLCIPQKLQWLDQHFGIKSTQCMFGSAKFLMAKPENLLIDDLDHNVDKFISHGGRAVLLPSNWNTENLSFLHILDALHDHV